MLPLCKYRQVVFSVKLQCPACAKMIASSNIQRFHAILTFHNLLFSTKFVAIIKVPASSPRLISSFLASVFYCILKVPVQHFHMRVDVKCSHFYMSNANQNNPMKKWRSKICGSRRYWTRVFSFVLHFYFYSYTFRFHIWCWPKLACSEGLSSAGYIFLWSIDFLQFLLLYLTLLIFTFAVDQNEPKVKVLAVLVWFICILQDLHFPVFWYKLIIFHCYIFFTY